MILFCFFLFFCHPQHKELMALNAEVRDRFDGALGCFPRWPQVREALKVISVLDAEDQNARTERICFNGNTRWALGARHNSQATMAAHTTHPAKNARCTRNIINFPQLIEREHAIFFALHCQHEIRIIIDVAEGVGLSVLSPRIQLDAVASVIPKI